jgi:hypothetical protein
MEAQPPWRPTPARRGRPGRMGASRSACAGRSTAVANRPAPGLAPERATTTAFLPRAALRRPRGARARGDALAQARLRRPPLERRRNQGRLAREFGERSGPSRAAISDTCPAPARGRDRSPREGRHRKGERDHRRPEEGVVPRQRSERSTRARTYLPFKGGPRARAAPPAPLPTCSLGWAAARPAGAPTASASSCAPCG